MSEPVRSGADRRINVFLPAGNAPDQNTALAGRIVAALRLHPVMGSATMGPVIDPMIDPVIDSLGEGAGGGPPAPDRAPRGEGSIPPSEHGPSLNAFIGVLTLPIPAGMSLEALGGAIRDVPGAGDVGVGEVGAVGIPPGETPR